MDVSVSRKEMRYQPSGGVSVLTSDITDLFPIMEGDVITDVVMLDDERDELLDQGMWAVFKQRGNDPLNLGDGNQYEEAILGEISAVTLMSQIMASVLDVGPGVKVEFSSGVSGGKEYLTATVSLTNAA